MDLSKAFDCLPSDLIIDRLGPLLFNMFLNDFLLTSLRSISCNFSNDNTLYCCGKTTENAMENLQPYIRIVSESFGSHQMMANPRKFQCM